MTSFEPKSRSGILPSGETFDLVSPGMSRVVARTFGVAPDIGVAEILEILEPIEGGCDCGLLIVVC
jgi:hypothetical protein